MHFVEQRALWDCFATFLSYLCCKSVSINFLCLYAVAVVVEIESESIFTTLSSLSQYCRELLYFMFPFGREYSSYDIYDNLTTVTTIWKPGFKEHEDIQISTLLYTMVSESEYVFTQFALDEKESRDYTFVIGKFDEHFRPERNVIHKRAMFHQRSQHSGESAEAYIRNLYEMAECCDLGTAKDNCIRDRLVIGVHDKSLSKRLQLKEELTLAECVKMVRQSEVIQDQLSIQNEVAKSIEEVKRPRYPKDNPKRHADKKQRECSRCGLSHGSSCPAKNAKCRKCNKPGHYARCCKTKQLTKVNCRYTRSPESSEEEFFIGTITDVKDDSRRWLVNLQVNGNDVKFKLNSGADVSVMSLSTKENMRKPPILLPTNHRLKGVTGALKCKGIFSCNTNYQGKAYTFDIYVTNSVNNLLSRTMAERMNLIKLNIQEVERGKQIRRMKGELVKIQLREGAVPFHCNTARRVPIPLIPKVKQELKRMEDAGVIKKATELTDWCSPMVVVPKQNGDVRVCVDLRRLNREVRRERYVLPTLEDMVTKLSGATVFTHLDLTSGYYHIELDPNSTKLTTFITPYGRYCFKRLPFGISSASETFQRRMTELLEGIDGVEASQDDILVAGRTMEEHDVKLRKVFDVIQEAGLKLNLKKCV